jgi:hypothetical protein
MIVHRNAVSKSYFQSKTVSRMTKNNSNVSFLSKLSTSINGCFSCGKTFSYKQSFKLHIKKQHGDAYKKVLKDHDIKSTGLNEVEYNSD